MTLFTQLVITKATVTRITGLNGGETQIFGMHSRAGRARDPIRITFNAVFFALNPYYHQPLARCDRDAPGSLQRSTISW